MPVLALAALVAGCAKPASSPVQSPAPSAQPAANVPMRALVIDAGKPGAPALDADQLAQIKAIAASAPPAVRKRLRYALAPDESGAMRFIVYDGRGLAADGTRPGKKFDYILFRLLNMKDGSIYDPLQNLVRAPIPPPKERDSIGIGN